MNFKEIWGWFDRNLFLLFLGKTQEEIIALPDSYSDLIFIIRKAYNIYMMLFFSFSITYMFAHIYEVTSISVYNAIIPSFVQLVPVIILLIMAFYCLGVSLWIEKSHIYIKLLEKK